VVSACRGRGRWLGDAATPVSSGVVEKYTAAAAGFGLPRGYGRTLPEPCPALVFFVPEVFGRDGLVDGIAIGQAEMRCVSEGDVEFAAKILPLHVEARLALDFSE